MSSSNLPPNVPTVATVGMMGDEALTTKFLHMVPGAVIVEDLKVLFFLRKKIEKA